MPKYDKTALRDAMEAVNSGSMTLHAASATFGVPKTTLHRRAKNNIDPDKSAGPPCILSKEHESHLCTWITHMSKIGFAITKNMLLDSVQILVKDMKISNNFRNNRPGRHWFDGFCKRNPMVTQRVSQNLIRSRAQVTAQTIKNWFSEITTYLENENQLNVLEDPSRIFNCDETAFFLSPKDNIVLAKKGEKAVYSFISNDEKECITTLIMGSANGILAPPMVLFPYQRIPVAIATNMPKRWGLGKSDSGWMTGENFFEYVANVFHKWLLQNNIKLPVILFLDGHVSHLTLSLSKFCQENGIILVALPPNTTHIMQPLDIAFFHPLKLAWRSTVQSWRMQKSGERIRREDFAPLLCTILDRPEMSENLKSGFRASGLYPFDSSAIRYEKLISNIKQSDTSTPVHNNKIDLGNFKFLEREIGEPKLMEFEKQFEAANWTGALEDKSLFYLWKNIKSRTKTLISNFSKRLDEDIITNNFELGDTTFENNGLDEGNIIDTDIINDILGENNEMTLDVMPDGSVKESQNSNLMIQNAQEKSTNILKDIDEPEKIENLPLKNVQNLNIPTPFKRNLFWPEPKLKPETSRYKEKVPAVASSEQWISYFESKRQKKEEKIKKSIERKEKKELKNENKKVKETISVGEESSNLHRVTNINSFQVQQYIIIKYEEEYFPGLVLEKNINEAKVKVMAMSGSNWKWPEKDDVLWYKLCDIIATIKEPQLINARGTYIVPEMKVIRSF